MSNKPSFDKSFASHEKAKHWHSSRNGKILPKDVSKGTSKKYWFCCDNCNHDFDIPLNSISRKDRNKPQWCPYCSKSPKKLCDNNDCDLCYEKSFASVEKSKYLHPTKNNNEKGEMINPRKLFKHSGNKYWFTCRECNHDFESTLAHITQDKWCPYCSEPSKKICQDNDCKHCFNKSFASHEKSKYWHSTLNKGVLTRNITKGSNKKYWFHCEDCEHDFESIIKVINRGSWCSYCSKPCKKICEDNNCKHCFKNSFASVEKSKYWHSTLNKGVLPRNVIKCSATKYWFKCHVCNHDFDASPSNIINEKWCPYCSHQYLCANIDCKHCFNKSFASVEKSKHWHPTKNNKIKPRDVFKSVATQFWFKCYKCQHDFKTCISHITRGNWCPYCSKPCKQICEDNNCKHCFNKSFASVGKSKHWHSTLNGEIKPRDVIKYSNSYRWFKCDVCYHDFEQKPSNVSPNKYNNNWCSYCSHQQLCNNDNCEMCFNMSFASHDKSKYWHPIKNINGEGDKINPRKIFKSSNKKYWFECKDCKNVFNKALNEVNRKDGKQGWCSICVNKTEKKLHHWIIEMKDEIEYIYYEIQYKPVWADLRMTHNTHYIYDFYIELNNVKIIIELDGRQHYIQVSNWSTPLHNLIRDKIKEKLATNEDINIIRLNQEDVFSDKGNWKKELIDCIQSIKENSDEIAIYNLVNEERYTNE